MGLHNRDYARFRPVNGIRRGGGFRDWEIWKKILAINIAVFLLQIIITRPATEADFADLPVFQDELAWEMQAIQEEMLAESDAQNANDAEQQAGGEETSAGEANGSPTSTLSDKQKQLIERRREIARKQMLEYMPRISVIQQWLQLDSEKVKQGQIWRLVTSGFCHDRMGIWHLLFNMLFLYWFGSRLEMKYGSREFLIFYLAGLICASLCFVLMSQYREYNAPAIGASGAIWAVTAVYALLYPYERIYVYFLFPVEIRFLVLIYFVFDLHPLLLQLGGDEYNDGVAHAAHVGGAVFGFLYWYNHWQLSPMTDRVIGVLSPQPRETVDRTRSIKMSDHNKKKETRHLPGEKSELDRILDKISRDGHDSLTDQELETLEQQSKRIRDSRQDESESDKPRLYKGD